MGCQTEIAAATVDSKASYCLAVKRNQPTLYDGIDANFSKTLDNDFADTKVRRDVSSDSGHERQVDRFSFICPLPKDLPDQDRWKGLKAIGAVVSISQRNGREHTEVRNYTLSQYLSGPDFANAVVTHWGIENNLHWQLDVTFGEDQCRLRKRLSDANFSILRRTTLSLLKNEQTAKVGIKNKRLMAGWNEDYLSKVLFK